MTVEVETIGMEKMVRSLNRVGSEVQDLSEPFGFVVRDFEEQEKKVFEKEGYPAKFAPLSLKYKAWKDQNYPGQKIMRLTGRLYDSLTTQSAGGDAVKEIGRKSARRVTNVPYAHRHQMGTEGMPRREVVQVTERIKRRWTRIVQRWALGLFEKYGITSYENYSGSGRWLVL